MTNKLLIAAVGVSVLLGVLNTYLIIAPSLGNKTTYGSVGLKLAENYDPYLRYNGGYYSNLPIQTNSTFQVGSNGTAVARLNTGTCYIQPYATTIAATSTVKVDCQATAATGGITTANDTALTGVTTGDNVVATLATSTAGTTSGGLVITGASASTTAGYIQLNIANFTGTTFTWPTTGTASGTVSYFASH